MQWNDITFGVEIECLIPDRWNAIAALQAAGLPVTVTGYTHQTTPGWKVVHDGSLQPTAGFLGREFVSPILSGESGLAQVRKVCEVLQAGGARINVSCGLHVHVGARSASILQVANLAKMFVKYEEQFDSLVPETRRGNANRYCQSNVQMLQRQHPTKSAMFAAISRAQSIERIATIMNGGSNRYYKMNLQSYATHGTVEFRQHSGSVDGQKIAAWVRLITGFTANAFSLRTIKNGPAPFEKLMRKVDRPTAAYLTQRRAVLDRRAAA